VEPLANSKSLSCLPISGTTFAIRKIAKNTTRFVGKNPEFDIALRLTGFKTGYFFPAGPLHPCSECTGRHLITFLDILNRACCMA